MDAYIPSEYIRDEKQKIEIYKKIRSVRTLEEARDLEEEIEDRFGDLPEPVINLLRVARIRAYAINTASSRWCRRKTRSLSGFLRIRTADRRGPADPPHPRDSGSAHPAVLRQTGGDRL